MSTKARYRNGILTFFESSTHEHVAPLAPVVFKEDFLGTLNADHWTAVDENGATEAKVANQPGGVFRLHLASNSEKEEAVIYRNDSLEFNVDKGLIAEFVVSITTLPTDIAEMYFGMTSAYVEGVLASGDNGPLVHAVFMLDGSGAVTIHTDDNVSVDNDAVATGVTLTASSTARHVFRIDFTDPADVLFFIDGVRVASATTFDMSAGSISLQPLAACFKASGAGVGDLDIDCIKIWAKR
jgi:hypothetical protein